MSLIGLLVTVIVVALLVWAVLQLGLPDPFPVVIKVLAVLFLVVYIAQAFGIFSTGPVTP